MTKYLELSFKTLRKAIFFTLCSVNCLQATSGNWINLGAGNWDVGTNWTSNPSFPNGTGEIASFIADYTSSPIIDSGTPITVGTLIANMSPSLPIAIQFSVPPFTFDAGLNQFATITATGGAGLIFNTDISLFTPIEVYTSNNVDFNNPISGATKNTVSLFNIGFNGTVNYNSPNNYTGKTLANCSQLALNSTSGPSIVGDLIIGKTGSVVLFAGDQFAPTTNLINYGSLVNNDMSQLNSITFKSGARSSSFNPISTFTVLDSVTALTLEGDTIFDASILVIQNQGDVVVDTLNFPGLAFYGNFGGNDVIDLGGGLVNFNIIGGSTSINLQFLNVFIGQGTFNKIGNGTILFEGPQNIIPQLNLSSGFIQIGSDSTGAVDTQGSFLIDGGTLCGFGTLGASGSANVTNASGFVAPGSHDTQTIDHAFGNLIISGSYTQNVDGTLLIKGSGTLAGTSDILTVTGNVNIDGNLRFEAQPENTFTAGDQVVLIDNTGGVVPITGTFSTVDLVLPQNLKGTIVYNSQQVILSLQTRCP